MDKVIQQILATNSYLEFEQWLCQLMTNQYKGDYQEYFAKLYFLSHSKHYQIDKYYSRLSDTIPKALGLSDHDLGSDGIIVHSDGHISLVQVKFRSDPNNSLTRGHLGGMSTEGVALKERLRYLYLFSNTYRPVKKTTDQERCCIKYILSDTLAGCEWELVQELARKYQPLKPIPKLNVGNFELRRWQKQALDFVLDHGTNFGRKQVIAACGAGKTFFARHLIDKPTYQRVLITVPNLHLLSQWFERLASWLPKRNYLLVGSDLSTQAELESFPFTLTTQSDQIETELKLKEIICISTYQSLDRVVSTYQSLDRVIAGNSGFDLVVADEAHRCCNRRRSNFTLVTRDDFPTTNRLFMTATPKIYSGAKVERVASMDDPAVFGPRYSYSFHKAIKEGIVNDYKIIVGAGTGQYSAEQFDAQFIVNSVRKYGLKSILVFSSSHKKSRVLYNSVKELVGNNLDFPKLELMPSQASSADKAKVVSKLETGQPIIIFNVRVFNVGSDLPRLESVMLRGGQRSVINTVQSVAVYVFNPINPSARF